MGEVVSKVSDLAGDLFKRFSISSRVSFWISSAALAIVLFNNHVYISYVQDREKEAVRLIEKSMAEADDLSKRERILRSWELSLLQREQDIGRLIRESKSVQ